MTQATLTHIDHGKLGDFWYVVGYDARGAEWTHYRGFLAEGDAQRLRQRVEAAALTINTENWAYRAPYGSQAYDEDGCEMLAAWQEREDEMSGAYGEACKQTLNDILTAEHRDPVAESGKEQEMQEAAERADWEHQQAADRASLATELSQG